MITAEQLRSETETNDIIFQYKEKEYAICWFNDIYHCGEVGNDNNDVEFKQYEEMLENWSIDGDKLKDILKQIKLM